VAKTEKKRRSKCALSRLARHRALRRGDGSADRAS